MRLNLGKTEVKKASILILNLYRVKFLSCAYYNFGKFLYIRDQIFNKNNK
jgi:hypothetical protein